MFRKTFLAFCATVLMCGCLEFGPNQITTAPAVDQIARCRKEMYLADDLRIQPLGFQLTQGIDDTIRFKFIAYTNEIQKVFRGDKVDTSKFSSGMTLPGDPSLEWWDAETHTLAGGQNELPNARFMNVGYRDNGDGSLTVYITWHET